MPTALIVDDKSENLYLLAAMLSGSGYEVQKAGNGKEALASARANPPALVISDILMPVMDGFSLCREWKQDPKLQRIPFIFYTATYTDPKDEQFALNLGADLFLIKPQEPDVFMSRIAGALKQQQAGQLLHSPPAAMEESSYLREYNAALIHKLEDKLVQLEHAAKVKDALLGSISHELRAPLTPVMLLVGLMMRDPDLPPALREDLETMSHHIEIEKRLISDLLDYAAMRSGALRLHRDPLSFQGLVRQAVALWTPHLQAAALHLDLRLEAADDQILGDQEHLRQVLWNLIHHAVTRSPRDGVITFRCWNPQPDRLGLEVGDAGTPMTAEAIAWIFAPFDREVRFGEGPGQNSGGLGLAVSKGMIEAHAGTMSIQSREPLTTLTVQFPVYRA